MLLTLVLERKWNTSGTGHFNQGRDPQPDLVQPDEGVMHRWRRCYYIQQLSGEASFHSDTLHENTVGAPNLLSLHPYNL